MGTELAAREDDLSEWAAFRSDALFLPAQPEDLTALRTVAAWAHGHGYTPSGVEEFVEAADYYLVGQALSLGYTVVTREKPENSLHRVKIPNACIAVGVKCITPFEMLRAERARFVLATPDTETPENTLESDAAA